MGPKTKNIYHLLLLFLSIALVAGIVVYLERSPLSMDLLQNINSTFIFLLILIHFISFFFLGFTQALPLKKHNIKISFLEWYGLCIIGETFNMILPANGGGGIRMLYLKDKKNLKIREFLSMNFAVTLIAFTMLGIIGTFYFQYILNNDNAIFKLLESLFIALGLTGIFLLIFSEILGKFFKIKRAYSPKIYLFDSKLTALLTLSWLAFFSLYPLKIYLSFMAIGVEISLIQSFEISLILIATSFFQILPGNVGVKELATAYISSHYGTTLETALIASLIDRFTLMLFLSPAGLYFYWQLFLESVLQKFSYRFVKPIQSEQTSP